MCQPSKTVTVFSSGWLRLKLRRRNPAAGFRGSRCWDSWPGTHDLTALDTIGSIVLTVAIDAEHTRQSAAGIARYARSLTAALKERDDLHVIELGGGEVVPRGTFRQKLLTA